MAKKPSVQLETFDFTMKSPRHQQTERAYHYMMQERLLSLLEVMNPQDRIHYGAMLYPELVVYAYDWMRTEVIELARQGYVVAQEKLAMEPTLESTEEPPGLSL